jgi:hypothetical protein
MNNSTKRFLKLAKGAGHLFLLALGLAVSGCKGQMGAAAPIILPEAIQPEAQISAPSEQMTSTGPVHFTVSYEYVSAITLTVDAISIQSFGTAHCDVEIPTATNTAIGNLPYQGSEHAQEVIFDNCTGDGEIAFSVDSNGAADPDGLPIPASGLSAAFLVGNTIPQVSIGTPSAKSTATGPVTFPITFTEAPNIDMNNSLIDLETTGTAQCSYNFEGGVVSFSQCSGAGTISFSIAAKAADNLFGLYSIATRESTSFTVAPAKTK